MIFGPATIATVSCVGMTRQREIIRGLAAKRVCENGAPGTNSCPHIFLSKLKSNAVFPASPIAVLAAVTPQARRKCLAAQARAVSIRRRRCLRSLSWRRDLRCFVGLSYSRLFWGRQASATPQISGLTGVDWGRLEMGVGSRGGDDSINSRSVVWGWIDYSNTDTFSSDSGGFVVDPCLKFVHALYFLQCT